MESVLHPAPHPSLPYEVNYASLNSDYVCALQPATARAGTELRPIQGVFDSVRVEDELCQRRARWFNSIANVCIDIVGEREPEEMIGECLSAVEEEAGSHR